MNARVLRIAVVASLLVPNACLFAQAATGTAPRATVTGTVFDSIGGKPLRGASVQIVGAGDMLLTRRYTASTDSMGRYAIVNVEAGPYLAGFQHSRLDTLGIESEERAVAVESGQIRLDLATPSPATFIGLVCADSPANGMMIGHVRATGTGAPLSDAVISASWSELDTTGIFPVQRIRESSIETAPTGWFALCGLPTDVTILARAASGSDSSGYMRLSLPARSMHVTTFHVGGATRDSTTGAATPGVWRGSARLSGIVRDERGQPMANARLSVWGTDRETTSDARGRFQLDELPGGTQTIEVRAIGFEPVDQVVQLSADDPATAELTLLNRVTELAGVNVTARTDRARLGAFYDRMRDAERGINHGYFITPEEMERRKPTLVTNVLEGLPGVRIVRQNLDPRSAVIHGALREAGGYCVMTVYLDGVRVAGPAGGGHDPINILVDPATIAAVEVYPRPVSAPPRYQSLNGTCGVVLIWTK